MARTGGFSTMLDAATRRAFNFLRGEVDTLDERVTIIESGGGGDFPEAPLDGQQYGRQSAAWSVIELDNGEHVLTGDPENPPADLDAGQLLWDGVEGGSGGGGGPHDHDEYIKSPSTPTTGNGLVWDGSTWVDEKLLRADGSNTFDGAKLLVPADFAIQSQAGTPRSLEFDSAGATRMSVGGVAYMQWSGSQVRVTAPNGIRSSHLGQYTSTMTPSTANRVTDYGKYTYDGNSSTGYGPQIPFNGTFTGNPIVVATVESTLAASTAGYYVRINNVSTMSVRFRHYTTNGFWSDGQSATVHWIAMGIRADGTREHDELESTDHVATGVVEPEELEGA